MRASSAGAVRSSACAAAQGAPEVPTVKGVTLRGGPQMIQLRWGGGRGAGLGPGAGGPGLGRSQA
jgi:hypothetical protein